MVFSTVAFAAEPEMSVTEVSDIQKYVSEMAGEAGIEPREPAAPITSATITDILQDTGHWQSVCSCRSCRIWICIWVY